MLGMLEVSRALLGAVLLASAALRAVSATVGDGFEGPMVQCGWLLCGGQEVRFVALVGSVACVRPWSLVRQNDMSRISTA